MYKLVSPNYNGSFEFNVYKNGGIDKFNVDMTLIPYNPYIHINPAFGNLYGADYDDARGLICGGDFSLPKYSDKWAEYQLNNRNYQLIFDRQVRNLDFNQKQEATVANVSAATGILKGTTTGLTAGAMTGNPYAAAAGAVVGLGTSTVGGAMDVHMMNDRQMEQKSMMIDNYKYQLGNIQALPDTINKVTPFTYNHKVFPFIEYYTCTDTEKALFKDYLKYNGMSVNAIGTIEEYLSTDKAYISGILLRVEDLGLSTQEISEIYNELNQGVYI